MNHWLQQATAPAPSKRQRKNPAITPEHVAHIRCHPKNSKALERVRELVRRQPVNTWFSAGDIFDDSVASVDYLRDLLKGMGERGELVAEYRKELSPHRDRSSQHMHKWMFKREK